MSKFIFFLTVMLFFVNTVTSQKVLLGVESGVATYSMSGLNKINNSIISQIPFKLKVVDDFPPSIYYRPFMSFQIERYRFGIMYTYTSTGSRLATKDYSGEYRFDMVLSAHSPSLHIDAELTQNSKINCYIRLLGGINLTELAMNEYFMFDDNLETDDNYQFISTNVFMEPSVYASTSYKRINLSVNIGYHAVLGNNPLHLEDNDKAELKEPNSEVAIKPNWNGIRAGISISYSIAK